MKNMDIVTLQNQGLQLATAHDADPAHAYKLFKLRKAVDKAYNNLAEQEEALRTECGIERGKKPSEEASKKFYELQKALMKDDSPLEGIKAVPYDVWIQLQKENRAKEFNGKKIDVLSGAVELILEDVFWTAPAEEPEPEANKEEKPKKDGRKEN